MGGDWRDKAGGLMCVGHSAAQLGDETRELLDGGVCGVILSASAFRDAMQIARVVYAIKRYAARPLFVGVSHETLSAVDENSGFSSLPSAPDLWRSADAQLARHVGEAWGRELRSVGVDMTLGPCVDVLTHFSARPAAPTLGSQAEHVSRMGAAFIEGQQSQGVAACASHFPGQGGVGPFVERDLPHSPHGIARLEEVELLPFRAAVAARAAGMMVGHIRLDALDSTPASLSRAIVFGLLRQKLGFRGLVMIDDVDVRALTERYSLDTIARLGVASSADCFLCVSRPETAFELIDAIERGVRDGEILPERIEAARRRIAPVLHRYVRDARSSVDFSGGVGSAYPERGNFPETGVFPETGISLDPGVNSTTHVGPGSLAADKKQHQH